MPFDIRATVPTARFWKRFCLKGTGGDAFAIFLEPRGMGAHLLPGESTLVPKEEGRQPVFCGR